MEEFTIIDTVTNETSNEQNDPQNLVPDTVDIIPEISADMQQAIMELEKEELQQIEQHQKQIQHLKDLRNGKRKLNNSEESLTNIGKELKYLDEAVDIALQKYNKTSSIVEKQELLNFLEIQLLPLNLHRKILNLQGENTTIQDQKNNLQKQSIKIHSKILDTLKEIEAEIYFNSIKQKVHNKIAEIQKNMEETTLYCKDYNNYYKKLFYNQIREQRQKLIDLNDMIKWKDYEYILNTNCEDEYRYFLQTHANFEEAFKEILKLEDDNSSKVSFSFVMKYFKVVNTFFQHKNPFATLNN